MKKTLSIILAVSALAGVRADSISYDPQAVGPLVAPLRYGDSKVPATDTRLIEPTSPVLGQAWAKDLRDDSRDPDEIVASIDHEYPAWERDVRVSLLALVRTYEPGLKAYCDPKNPVRTTPPAQGWTEVIPAAIPLEILIPMHDQYVKNVEAVVAETEKLSDEELAALAFHEAHRYQSLKEEGCGPVIKFDHLEKLAREMCLGGCKKLLAINHRLSAPEAAYPRAEFSINGYTQYVYAELMKMPKLKEFLHEMLAAENDWLRDARQGTESMPMMTQVELRLRRAGFTAREALLGLSYSTRNMPSLDVHYGYDPRAALTLEIYFWKFHAIREELIKSHIGRVFPNHVFKEDPGLYHYATAGLLACELTQAGYVGTIGRKMALLSKLMYKMDKLLKEAPPKLILKKGPSLLFKTMKEQGFITGVEAGQFGGKHGVKLCKADKRPSSSESEEGGLK